VWRVLNPEGKDAIVFADFVRGMLRIAEDPELKHVMPLDRPNRFQLLSLVIDAVRQMQPPPASSTTAPPDMCNADNAANQR
jgi:hypothetical protein